LSYNTPTYDSGPVYVYGLVDPMTGAIFYVGISIDPWQRLSGHRGDPASSARNRVREIIAAGLEVEIDILEEHPTRHQTELRERVYLAVLPGLVNRERRLPYVFR
jgi:hypothetical protein